MLSFTDVSLRRGPRLLFESASFTINAGDKVGVTGANGCGKSSLFAMILGELASDRGDLSMPPGLEIAHLAQEIAADDTPALDYVLAGDRELVALEDALARAEAAGDGERIGALHGQIEAVDGYAARARAATLMHGLGFTPGSEQTPVKALSGGWRVRLNLARTLMCRSDLLLLDEPTNHLDLDAVLWLQDWLRGYTGTLLLISHDREFLDAVVNRILHVEGGGVRLYTGNHSAFERQRAERLAQQQAAHLRQQREIAHIHRFVERFRAKASKARQAQSRLKALERMETIAPAHADSPFHFEFPDPERVPDPLLKFEHADVGYGETPVLNGVGFSVGAGERVALLGRNGAGKSTLVRWLAGELTARGGEVFRSPELKVGYFAQHQLEQLDGGATPLQHLMRLDPRLSDQRARDFLGGFGFRGDAALAPVAPFSGGEKARLVLALIAFQRPNLLLLDEPTNHLDLEMRHALALALQGYSGSLVVVSHDRSLLRSVADRLLLVADGRVQDFDGDLEDYAAWLADRDETGLIKGEGNAPAAHTAEARKARKREAAERRQALAPLRRELKSLDRKLEELADRKREMETRLADPTLYTEAGKEPLKRLLADQAGLVATLQDAEARWLEVSESLESAEQSESG